MCFGQSTPEIVFTPGCLVTVLNVDGLSGAASSGTPTVSASGVSFGSPNCGQRPGNLTCFFSGNYPCTGLQCGTQIPVTVSYSGDSNYFPSSGGGVTENYDTMSAGDILSFTCVTLVVGFPPGTCGTPSSTLSLQQTSTDGGYIPADCLNPTDQQPCSYSRSRRVR